MCVRRLPPTDQGLVGEDKDTLSKHQMLSLQEAELIELFKASDVCSVCLCLPLPSHGQSVAVYEHTHDEYTDHNVIIN